MHRTEANLADLSRVIGARSRRQAMDWSLVLASQGIEVAIAEPSAQGWQLVVPAADHERALEAIRSFRLENRRWAWQQPLPDSELTFHWGALVWVFVIALIEALPVDLAPVAAFKTSAVRNGEWWRALTAVWLHADLGHMASNATIGVVALGLAMSRYGVAQALLLGVLAGTAGNALGLTLRSRDYIGVGASGLVLGTVGMLSAQAVSLWKASRHATRRVLAALLAGGFLFLILGTDPRGDILAHTGGYAAGLLLGAVATWTRFDRHPRVASAILLPLLIVPWMLAMGSVLYY